MVGRSAYNNNTQKMNLLISLVLSCMISRVEIADNEYVSIATPSGYSESQEYPVLFLEAGLEYNDEFWFGSHGDLNALDGFDYDIILVSIPHTEHQEDTIRTAYDYIVSNYSSTDGRWCYGGYSSGAQDVFGVGIKSCTDIFGSFFAVGGAFPIYKDNVDIEYLSCFYGANDMAMYEIFRYTEPLIERGVLNDDNFDIESIPERGHEWYCAIYGLNQFVKHVIDLERR